MSSPQDKLKEIEECPSVRSGDIEWLIKRVKALEEALVYVIKDLDMIGVTKSEIAQLEVCRKALRGEE